MSLFGRYVQRGLDRYFETEGIRVSRKGLLRTCKARNLTRVRSFVACYLHALPNGFSFTQIAKMLGYTNHTTVLHQLRRGHGHDGKLLSKYTPFWPKSVFERLAYLDAPEAYDRPASDKLASDVNRLLDSIAVIATFHSNYG